MNDKLGGDGGSERPEIKVVDRRSFTSDGQRRQQDAPAPEDAPSAPSGGGAGEPPRETGGPVKGQGFTMHKDPEGEEARAEREAAFLNLCVSIYESGCLHLGIGRDGKETGGALNMEGARGAVAMLEMLKRKTAGNLSEEETRILDSLLADLQMAYVMKAPDASS